MVKQGINLMTQSTVQSEHFNSQQQSHSHLGSVQNNKAANSERRIRLSTSDNFFNKENLALERNGSQKWAYAQEFDQQEWTRNEIESHVLKGKAILVAVCRKNYRKTENFISSQIIGVDIDEGHHQLTELTSDEFIQKHATLIYATPSSTPENPRWRILFILDEPITDPEKYKDLVIRLNGKLVSYNVDPACKDAVRLFYGSKTDDYIVFPDNVLPVELIDTFPLLEGKAKKPPNQSNNKSKQAQSASEDTTALPRLNNQLTNHNEVDSELNSTLQGDRFTKYVRAVTSELLKSHPTLAEGMHVTCPNPHHNDEHPSFRISYDIDKTRGKLICTCGSHSWKEVGEWIGLPYNQWSAKHLTQHLPRKILSEGSLDNSLREYLLRNGYANAARLWDILLLVGWRPGYRFSEAEAVKAAKKFHIGRPTISEVLKMLLSTKNEGGTKAEIPLFRLDSRTQDKQVDPEMVNLNNDIAANSIDDVNYVTDCNDNCYTVAVSGELERAAKVIIANDYINHSSTDSKDSDIKRKRGRSISQYYVMPDQNDIMTFLGIKPMGISDTMDNGDLISIKAYRSALTYKLIERRPGIYNLAFLSNRLGVNKSTEWRHISNNKKIVKHERRELLRITSANINDLLTVKDKQYRLNNFDCLIDKKGKRYPPSLFWGKKLLTENSEPILVRRLAGHYSSAIKNQQDRHSRPLFPLLSDKHSEVKISRLNSSKGGVPEEVLLHRIYEYVSKFYTMTSQ